MGRRRRRDRPLGDRPVGRLRDDHLAAPHQRPLPTRQVVLPHYLAALAGGRPAAAAPAGGCVLELLRSPFVAPAPGALGDRDRARLRHAGMGRRLGAQHDRRRPRIRGRHVHERDVVPRTPIAKTLTVIEAGTGFAFLALVIGYFPVIYQAFSRREMAISLLDARAGSPPTAGELLWRYRWDKSGDALAELLREWERWAADVLESHLSYPALAYFRSQHYNQSWLGALTTILDASALIMVGRERGGHCARQAALTFAMARHALVDLAQVFNTPPHQPAERLAGADFPRLQ